MVKTVSFKRLISAGVLLVPLVGNLIAISMQIIQILYADPNYRRIEDDSQTSEFGAKRAQRVQVSGEQLIISR
jgi:hypothetical protein